VNGLEEIADRVAIRELIDRYTVGVSTRDWERVGACFADDARWTTSVGHDFQGVAAIVAGIRKVVEVRKFLIQMTHGMTIETLDGDNAETTSILNEFGTGDSIFVLGTYHDKLVKADGTWRFKSRLFKVHYIDTTPMSGNAMVDYATLR
jgi:hypothetical protein